jgi:hypothetical protein
MSYRKIECISRYPSKINDGASTLHQPFAECSGELVGMDPHVAANRDSGPGTFGAKRAANEARHIRIQLTGNDPSYVVALEYFRVDFRAGRNSLGHSTHAIAPLGQNLPLRSRTPLFRP